VCRKVWDDTNADATEITAATVRIGSVDTALREYYEEQLAEVSRETRMRRRKLRRWFERRFITQDGWRARVFEQNRRVAGLASEIAERFTRRYLLRSVPGDVRWFELARSAARPIQIAAQLIAHPSCRCGGRRARFCWSHSSEALRLPAIRECPARSRRRGAAASIAADPQPETKRAKRWHHAARVSLLDRMDQSALGDAAMRRQLGGKHRRRRASRDSKEAG
jgi:hypothetical protein